MKKNDVQVGLILKQDFGENIVHFAERMPVWVIESEQNNVVIDRLRKANMDGAEFSITTFPARERESKEKCCERIVGSLDDHHNDFSQTPGYTELVVIGVFMNEVSQQPFLSLGFNRFLPTDAGFVAKKLRSD